MVLRKSQVVCSFYLTNSCKSGTDCPFFHGQRPGLGVCKYYLAGACIFGDECRNSHDTLDAVSCVDSRPAYCSKGGQFQSIREHSSTPPLRQGALRRSSEAPRIAIVQASPSENCRLFYQRSGYPLKREDFKFLHSQAPRSDESRSEKYGKSVHGRRPGYWHVDQTAKPVKGNERNSGLEHNKDSYDLIRVDTGRARNLHVNTQGTSNRSSGVKVDQTLKTTSSTDQAVEHSFLDGVRALIGPGGAVLKVITAFDSCRVMLANVPEEATQSEIITMAEAFGPLKSAVLMPPCFPNNRTAKLEYLDTESAKIAAATLDGVELHTKRMMAQLDLHPTRAGVADLRSSTLKLSWFAPSRLAYAHFDSVSEARLKASELDGKDFSGRQVATAFQQPSSFQMSNFTAIIKNLPVHVKMHGLEEFCGTESVKIGQANYHGKKGIMKVRELLETFGPLESFDYSRSSPGEIKIKVLARFFKPEHAALAVDKLRDRSQSFLAGAKIWVALVHSIKYSLYKVQYRVLKDDLRCLQTSSDRGAKMRVYSEDERGLPVDPVRIRIYGDDPKTLIRMKTHIENLVSGDEVIHESMALWDSFFVTKAGEAFVREVHKVSGAFVRIDSRRRKVRVSGSVHQKDAARQLLLAKFHEVRAHHHHLQLTRSQLGALLRSELSRLQGILGEEKLAVDIRSRVLVIRGNGDDIAMTRLSLNSLRKKPASPENKQNKSVGCPVCFCDVEAPLTLACGHAYCFLCLRRYLTSVEIFPVSCLAETDQGRCQVSIPLSTIRDTLSVEDEAKLFNNAFMTYVHQHPKEYHFCPSPDCQQVYRPAEPGRILRCPSCLSCICPSCDVEFHDGITCAEYVDIQNGGMLAYRKWKEENDVKSCPNCTADIEKSAGCNHLTCVRCGCHICWVCLQTWPESQFVYEHMRTEHGGIGL